jgi:hypothetical protein
MAAHPRDLNLLLLAYQGSSSSLLHEYNELNKRNSEGIILWDIVRFFTPHPADSLKDYFLIVETVDC